MADDNNESKRVAVSKREPLDKNGEPQSDWLDAAGGAYTVNSSGTTHVAMWNELPKPVQRALMYAGFSTFAGNQTNTVRSAIRAGEDPGQTEDEALAAWIQNLRDGNWTSPRGEVEAGVPMLAQAIARVKSEADGKVRDDDAIKAIGAWLSASEIADEAERKTTAKARKSGARARPDVKLALLAIQTERAQARAATADAGAGISLTDMPG